MYSIPIPVDQNLHTAVSCIADQTKDRSGFSPSWISDPTAGSLSLTGSIKSSMLQFLFRYRIEPTACRCQGSDSHREQPPKDCTDPHAGIKPKQAGFR